MEHVTYLIDLETGSRVLSVALLPLPDNIHAFPYGPQEFKNLSLLL